MEKRLQVKIERHQQVFKDDIKNWLQVNNASVKNGNNEDIIGDLLQYIYDYNNLVIEKEDFQKRKRTKNTISEF